MQITHFCFCGYVKQGKSWIKKKVDTNKLQQKLCPSCSINGSIRDNPRIKMKEVPKCKNCKSPKMQKNGYMVVGKEREEDWAKEFLKFQLLTCLVCKRTFSYE